MKWILLIILLLFLLYLFLISPRLSFKKRMNAYEGVMFAHRGYHDIDQGIPENSMPAFKRALDHGYGIELDVHLSLDGEIVVFHDDTLKRICASTETVEELTAKDLTSRRLSGTREHMPLLKDVLKLVNGQVPLLIELKIPTKEADELCSKVNELMKEYTGPYLIQSFNTMGLKWYKRHAPHVLRGQLSSNLVKSDPDKPWLYRFAVKHMLCNALGRPDFISYKLLDLPNPSLGILKRFYRTPVAVWTLRTPSALRTGKKNYDMQIFENRRKKS